MSETAPSSRARKIRAVLAGGLALGVGAAIMLAASNDSESVDRGFSLEASTESLGGGAYLTEAPANLLTTSSG